MRQIINHLYLIIVVLIMGCTGCGDTTDEAQTDKEFDQVKSMADSLYSRMQFRDAYDLYLQLLDNEEVKADNEKRLSVIDALSSVSELAGHKAEETKWLQQLLSLAKQTGNDFYHSMALMEMGQHVFYEGDREQGIKYANEAIALIEKTDREDTDHLMFGHLIMLARLYGEMKDYDSALKTNERNLQLMMEGTRWGAAPSQQLIDRRMALAKLAALLAQMGRTTSGSLQNKYYQRADSAYVAWQAVKYEGNHTRDYFIVDYLKKRGLYQKAVPIYIDLIQRVRKQGDTLGEMMNTAKWGLAEAYCKMGNYRQAAALYEQVLEIQDTLKRRKAKNTAQELAAVYHAQDQEQKIMEQETKNTRQKVFIIINIVVLLGVAALAIVVIFKNRAIRSKNQSLAAQITEAMTYKEKYLQEMSGKIPTSGSATDINTLSDEQLFNYINDIVIRERLFLNPNFDRQALMDRFQLTKERAGAAFSKGSEYTKLTDYTHQLRLEYSTLLMSNNPDMSIAQIAAECGFSSYDYFGKCFRKRFGMTPTEFRLSTTSEA